MWFDSPLLLACAQILALAIPGAILAWALRLSGAPGGRHGAAILAGILAGVLLGPAVLGRMAPETHDRLFVGAVEQTQALRDAERRQMRDVEALQAADASEVAIEEARASFASEMASLRADIERAERRHASRIAWLGGGLIALHVLLASALLGPARRGRSLGGAAIPAGAFAVIGAAVIPVAAGVWLMRLSTPGALAFGLCFAVPGLAFHLPRAVWSLSLVGVSLAAVGGGWLARAQPWPTAPALVALPVALLLAPMAPARVRRAWRRWALGLGAGLTVPLLAALAAIRCDPFVLAGSRVFWIGALTGLLLAGDGRWLAGAGALRFFGPAPVRALWTQGAGFVNAGAGFAMLAFALLLFDAGAFGAEALGALLIGALTLETTRGLRSRMSGVMDGEAEGDAPGRG